MKHYPSVFVLLLVGSLAFSTESQKKALYHINQKIAHTQEDIYQYSAEQNQVRRYLLKNKTTTLFLKTQLADIQKKLKDIQEYLVNLKNEKEKYRSILKKSYSHLQYRYYTLLKTLRCPIFIDQKTYLKHATTLHYASYLYALQAEKIQSTAQLISKMANIALEIQHNKANLERFSQLQREKQKKIQILKTHHMQILQALDQRIYKKQKDLATFITNRKSIERTIQHLSEQQKRTALLNKPSKQKYTPSGLSFTKPVLGKAVYLFGKHIEESQLTWKGMLFYAPFGTAVHAAASGKVVFSQWLKGYGLLLIIQHNEGYLSLYGRNALLHKNVGDYVRTGECIAEVGKTGGYEKPALYFGIWRYGKAVNPKNYLGK